MATTSPNAPYTVQIAGQTNSQQVADGLPSYKMYANIPGTPNGAGPRSAGLSSVSNAVRDSEGYVLGGPQDPAPAPQVETIYRPGPKFYMRPIKPMWEPSVYVPGKGWVNSANS